ncbi:hypothetical protein SISSUDRAFT_1063921 [Sistotremastrum suecicum HHB10207 ss-3]|uniref:F-box domain-containing protein n=1 Tax=Sistotremastrum suecicum HHB10207 ss-3 TaxID=1314776 RepID=A0A166B9F5_9AGAM|nr:hypothetical protein SISSUDRAFT_1063921 [Sistotremastrum suecicum HHB10207 ss-3]
MSQDQVLIEPPELWSEIESSVAKGVQHRLVWHKQSGKKLDDAEQAFGRLEGKLSVFLKQQRNMFTAIGGLSDELILEILQYSIIDEEPRYNVGRRKKAALNPAFSLCARWRKIAVNTPSLWTTISLPSDLRFFRLCRDRSETLPLKLWLSDHKIGPKESIMDVLGTPLRHLVPRVATLHVDWSGGDCTLNAFFKMAIGQKEWPSLISLNVSNRDWDLDQAPVLNTPMLQELQFYGGSDDLRLVPFGKLVKFYFESCTLDSETILTILAALHCVEHCEISNTDPPLGRPEGDLPLVVLPKLKTLRLHTLEVEDAARVYRQLETPSAATIHFRTHTDDDPTNQASFGDLVGPEMAHCEKLSISWPSDDIKYTLESKTRGTITFELFSPENAPPRFRHLSTLSTHPTNLTVLNLHLWTLPCITILIPAMTSWSSIIQIGVCTEETEFEKLLTVLEETPEVVCPKLTTVNCSGTKFSSVRMKCFLQCRRNYDVPLQELKTTKGFAEPDVEIFMSLVPILTVFDSKLSVCGFEPPWFQTCMCNLDFRDQEWEEGA